MSDLSHPILNSPYSAPECDFEIGPNGPTGKILDSRRRSKSFVPIPAARKGKKIDQQAIGFDTAGERREVSRVTNNIRSKVEPIAIAKPWTSNRSCFASRRKHRRGSCGSY